MRFVYRKALAAAGLLCGAALACPARADEKAESLLRDVLKAARGIDSLSAGLRVTLTTQNLGGRPAAPGQQRPADSGFTQGAEPISFTYTGTVRLRRPNLERIQLLPPVSQTIASDGTFRWTLLPTNEYIKVPADPEGRVPGAYGPVLLFFAPDTALTGALEPGLPGRDARNAFASRYLGREHIARRSEPGAPPVPAGVGDDYDVIEVRQLRPPQQSVRLYINSDRLVERTVTEVRRGGVVSVQDVSFRGIKLGPQFGPNDFVFQLPADARPFPIRPAGPAGGGQHSGK